MTKHISFVVQGPIVRGSDGNTGTSDCLRSIRRHFPDSEIILSTWVGQEIAGLESDLHVLSPDPGGFVCSTDKKIQNNVNRQIVSTLAGLRRASNETVVKIRSDMLLVNSAITRLDFSAFRRDPDYSIFSERVAGCKYYFRNPWAYGTPFHPSDIILIGSKRDLLTLWNIPLSTPENSTWLQGKARPPADPFPNMLYRYCPEQYVWISCLQQATHKISLDYPWQKCIDQFQLSDQLLVNNFYILSPEKLGVLLPKRLVSSTPLGVYSEADWRYLYRRYVENDSGVTDHSTFRIRNAVRSLIIKLSLSYNK